MCCGPKSLTQCDLFWPARQEDVRAPWRNGPQRTCTSGRRVLVRGVMPCLRLRRGCSRLPDTFTLLPCAPRVGPSRGPRSVTSLVVARGRCWPCRLGIAAFTEAPDLPGEQFARACRPPRLLVSSGRRRARLQVLWLQRERCFDQGQLAQTAFSTTTARSGRTVQATLVSSTMSSWAVARVLTSERASVNRWN